MEEGGIDQSAWTLNISLIFYTLHAGLVVPVAASKLFTR